MTSPLRGTVDRRVRSVALERLNDEPVLLLEGARAVGKSTLLQQIADQRGVPVIDFDDPAVLATAGNDPQFMIRGRAPVCIDEYQKLPIVLDAIKAELNRDLRPGRFVLTGSTSRDALPHGSQSLTGRLHTMQVRPLSQAELAGSAGLVADLITDDVELRSHAVSTTSRDDYVARIVAGGFPIALTRSAGARTRWLEDHVRNSLQRDTVDLARIRQAATLPRLFSQLAMQTGQLLNMSSAGQAIELDARTANSYTHLLEQLFLLHRLPAWLAGSRSNAGKSPKVHVVDSGVACAALGTSEAHLNSRRPAAQTLLGHLLETFAYGEVASQASVLEDVRELFHFRNRGGAEVDLLIERRDGGVVGIEVKASGQVQDRDLRGLRALRSVADDRFVRGVVFYLGSRSYNSDGFTVLPLDRLWS